MCLNQTINPAASPTQGATPAAASASCCGDTPWMPHALGELGQREVAGLNSANPRIMEYHAAGGWWGTDDSTATNAWCATFVSWALIQAGYTKSENSFRASSYSRTVPNIDGNGWPTGVVIPRPVYGATAHIFENGQNHVGFVAGWKPGSNETAIGLLGGNQGDEVNVTEYALINGGRRRFTFMVPENYRWECCDMEDYTGAMRPPSTRVT